MPRYALGSGAALLAVLIALPLYPARVAAARRSGSAAVRELLGALEHGSALAGEVSRPPRRAKRKQLRPRARNPVPALQPASWRVGMSANNVTCGATSSTDRDCHRPAIAHFLLRQWNRLLSSASAAYVPRCRVSSPVESACTASAALAETVRAQPNLDPCHRDTLSANRSIGDVRSWRRARARSARHARRAERVSCACFGSRLPSLHFRQGRDDAPILIPSIATALALPAATQSSACRSSNFHSTRAALRRGLLLQSHGRVAPEQLPRVYAVFDDVRNVADKSGKRSDLS